MSTPPEKAQTEVERAVELALKNRDFRLYAGTGRSQVLPGISGAERKKALALCGYKPMKGTGDVLKKESQRQELKKKFAFMADYNRRMLAICKQRKDKV
ncbi:hypothetical protein SG34_023765 [Thalassomonas viridans]|uniref:Uncharacterized protein n=1 Tax=Thalassomonas viridans TaxID=137584 RepID=A0AAE9Z161_9GAMM|nr:hypothetical protein [Thalassomonas viridans]WDE04327.1 hypothetical protein SG34_023765 [Thalassomonas viridans]